MILQLNPPIYLGTPKGGGLAWLVTDYGAEHHLLWTVAMDKTGEVWTFPNPEVRADKNITMGRLIQNKEMIIYRVRSSHATEKNFFNKKDAENYIISLGLGGSSLVPYVESITVE